MRGLSCAQARQRLIEILQDSRVADLPPELRAHLAACPVCRASLTLIGALDLASMPEPIDCSDCQRDLPAFIDWEDDDGPRGAVGAYPGVWWHLWTCATCLEVYDMARALVDAQRRGELSLPRSTLSIALPTRLIQLLRLTRQFLNLALPAPQPAVARGSDDGPMVISEGTAPGGARFILSVEARHSGDWSVVVRVTPAPAGTLVLTLGETVFRAPFDASGLAIISDVPAALLTAVNGPEMLVDIALDDRASP